MCADPGVPENGFRTPSGGVFFESSVTRFHCQDGFKLKGSTKRLCMKHLNGTLGWIPSDRPICVQEGKAVPSTPTPSSWKLLPWSARGAGVPRLCARGTSSLGCSLFQGWSSRLMEEHACSGRAGARDKCISASGVIFLLCLNYKPIYRHFCQCKRATQIT